MSNTSPSSGSELVRSHQHYEILRFLHKSLTALFLGYFSESHDMSLSRDIIAFHINVPTSRSFLNFKSILFNINLHALLESSSSEP